MVESQDAQAFSGTTERGTCYHRISAENTAGVRVMHDVHSTHTRAVVENGTVMWKVRLFSDDLEKGLRAYARRPAFALDGDLKADSLFTAYFKRAGRRPRTQGLAGAAGRGQGPGGRHRALVSAGVRRRARSATRCTSAMAT